MSVPPRQRCRYGFAHIGLWMAASLAAGVFGGTAVDAQTAKSPRATPDTPASARPADGEDNAEDAGERLAMQRFLSLLEKNPRRRARQLIEFTAITSSAGASTPSSSRSATAWPKIQKTAPAG